MQKKKEREGVRKRKTGKSSSDPSVAISTPVILKCWRGGEEIVRVCEREIYKEIQRERERGSR